MVYHFKFRRCDKFIKINYWVNSIILIKSFGVSDYLFSSMNTFFLMLLIVFQYFLVLRGNLKEAVVRESLIVLTLEANIYHLIII